MLHQQDESLSDAFITENILVYQYLFIVFTKLIDTISVEVQYALVDIFKTLVFNRIGM